MSDSGFGQMQNAGELLRQFVRHPDMPELLEARKKAQEFLASQTLWPSGTCWFCGERTADPRLPALFYLSKMGKKEFIERPRAFRKRNYEIPFVEVLVSVPRCVQCREAHAIDDVRGGKVISDRSRHARLGVIYSEKSALRKYPPIAKLNGEGWETSKHDPDAGIMAEIDSSCAICKKEIKGLLLEEKYYRKKKAGLAKIYGQELDSYFYCMNCNHAFCKSHRAELKFNPFSGYEGNCPHCGKKIKYWTNWVVMFQND